MSFTFFGKTIPFYGLFLYIGVLLASAVCLFLCKKRKHPIGDLVAAASYAMIGGMCGSKLLFLAVSWKQILALHLPLEAVIKGGFVFYGGVIGGLLGVVIYAKQFKRTLIDYLDLFAVPLPLGHAFGRIGCFYGGCCYGRPYSGPWHHVYHTSFDLNTPLDTPLFPVQLISAIGLFFLFIALLIVFLRSKKIGTTFYAYVIAYPIMRFAVEFLRGDRERGLYFGLSIAQWVSLAVLLGLTVYFAAKKRLISHSCG